MLSHMESPVPDMLELRMQNLSQNWPKAQQEKEMQVPGWLVNLINKCLEKLPENRYSNGTELHKAIGFENSSIDGLIRKNEELNNQLNQYRQQQFSTAGTVSIPKRNLLIFALVFATLFGIAIAGWVRAKHDADIAYSKVSLNPSILFPAKIIPYPLRVDTSKIAAPKPLSTYKPKQKKKRRKFLGLF